MWRLVSIRDHEEFENLIELIKSIKTANQIWYRLPPTGEGKIYFENPLFSDIFKINLTSKIDPRCCYFVCPKIN